ncbi:3-ketoacyl-CoA synthase 6 [Striga asiatica]|uniref:3-ketoacyl-CoA synthase 6 n=1 Tax=Striga asiatica TaxID=4170 RepID=A0A5A7QVD4_STRAF|nr:3-ketoacyl-CoA synthase 6 [Striga asiatica]
MAEEVIETISTDGEKLLPGSVFRSGGSAKGGEVERIGQWREGLPIKLSHLIMVLLKNGVPVKWLKDTLKIERVGMFRRSLGNGPVNSLLFRMKEVRFFKLARFFGISPESELEDKSSTCREYSCPKLAGMGPSKLLPANERDLRSFIPVRLAGMGPFSKLRLKLRTISETDSPIEGGRLPEILLPDISRIDRVLQVVAISAGI